MYGQLGLGHKNSVNTFQPLVLPEGKVDKQVACGDRHSFVVTTDGSLYSCSWNAFGELGLGHVDDQSPFQLVILPGNRKAKIAKCGWGHSLVRSEDGSILTCGSNGCGAGSLGAKALVEISARLRSLQAKSLLAWELNRQKL